RGQGRPALRGVHRRPLAPLPARPRLTTDEVLSTFQGFVLGGFFSAHPDQGSPRRISRWTAGVPPLIYAIPPGVESRGAGTMIHRATSPPSCGEARRPIRPSVPLWAEPPRYSGYRTYEPAAHNCCACAASRTTEPPD